MGCCHSSNATRNGTLLTTQGPVKEGIQNIKEDLNNVEDFVKAINKAILPKLQAQARRQLIQKVFDAADAAASKAAESQAVAKVDAVVAPVVDAAKDAAASAVDAAKDAAVQDKVEQLAVIVEGDDKACKEALFQALHPKLDEKRKEKLKIALDVFLADRPHRDAFRRALAISPDAVEDLTQPEQLVSALDINLNPKQMRAFVRLQLSVEQMEAEKQAQELDDYWRPEMAQARKDDIKAALARAQGDEYCRQCFQEAYHAHRLIKALMSGLNPVSMLIQAARDVLLRPLSTQEDLAAHKQTLVQALEVDLQLDPARKAELMAAIDVHCGDQEHLAALRSACERLPVEVPTECQDLPPPADDDDGLSDFDCQEWEQERRKYAHMESLRIESQQLEPTPVETAQGVVESLVDTESAVVPPNNGEVQVKTLTPEEVKDTQNLAEQATEEHAENPKPSSCFCQG